MRPLTERRWLQRPCAEADAGALAATLGLTDLTARILARREIADVAQGRRFLEARLGALPDPEGLLGMPEAVARLIRALECDEKILVHGDYDVDGITGTALLVEFLSTVGGRVEPYIPLRLRDGYGLSAAAIDDAAHRGIGLILSVDCGISALAEAELAAARGIDLVITDHHQPPARLPAATAILNPHQPGCPYPEKDLAGVGVAFLLLVALRRALRERGWFTAARPEPDLRRWLDLVALGTIADVVPLRGVNRTFVRAGLELLQRGERPGIAALRELAQVDRVTCGAVGYRLAPRLNAAGRLEDATLGVELLLTAEPARARSLAGCLEEFNRERQALEQATLAQAVALLEGSERGTRPALVLACEGWHPGVIGIVASRLVERYHRPVVMVALEGGEGKGSARSIPRFHLFEALQECAPHLLGFGGHAAAAGLTLRADQLSAFSAAFERVAAERIAPDDLIPALVYDEEVELPELDEALARELEQLAPFGIGNPEPLLLLSSVRPQQTTALAGGHWRFTARQGGYSLPCVAFGQVERWPELPATLDLLGHLQINRWKGREQLQFQVRDLRPAAGPA